ncbi:MAG: sn-glycerol-3-phosphate ABC transporter substrate-binding protein UgpB, partial [Desulfobacteraceae bacterium]|nr:sn-glycerol-3-phosphate ABC transporter substrate-binding protein UgpB [Desulfobacteraceae bacterium]
MKLTKLFGFLIVVLCLALPASVFAEPITINWWHAMRSARGEVVKNMINDFNASQPVYKVVGTNKGNYDETMNAGVAAFRAKKQPHLLQVFEVGTQTMMLSGAIYPVFELMKDAKLDVDWSRYL